MHMESPSRAKLLVELSENRYRCLSAAHRIPCIGDMLVLDQSFTDPNGLPMVLAYFPGPGNQSLYEAEVYDSELE
jgi:hypothetical protein